MTREQMIQRLVEFDKNAQIQVHDLTGTQDHWEVEIESQLFQGLSRIEQHQLVMKCFHQELKTGEVHALSLKTKPKVH